MCGESLDRGDQPGDPRRGVLNLRGDPANRAAGCAPPQDRGECGSIDGGSDPVECLDRHSRFGKRPSDSGVDAVIGEPVGDGVLALGLLNRREHALQARRRGRRRAAASPAAS